MTIQSTTTNSLPPDIFQPILPQINTILRCVQENISSASTSSLSSVVPSATQPEDIIPSLKKDDVLIKEASNLRTLLSQMQQYSFSLPGGTLNFEQIDQVEEKLDEEIEKRRQTLKKFMEMGLRGNGNAD